MGQWSLGDAHPTHASIGPQSAAQLQQSRSLAGAMSRTFYNFLLQDPRVICSIPSTKGAGLALQATVFSNDHLGEAI